MRSYSIEDVIKVFPDYKICGSKEVIVRVCPNCGDDRFKFYLNPRKGVGFCFYCEFSPKLESLLGSDIIPSDLGVPDIPDVEQDSDLSTQPEPLPRLVSPLSSLDAASEPVRFLKSRRIAPSLVDRYQAGYCQSGKFSGRIIFPLFYRDEYIGFQGRYISDGLPRGFPKWITGAGTRKSRFLWNYERVIQNQKWCILVEGIFDSLRVPQVSVALLGKTASDYQKTLLSYFDYIFVMLDSDATEEAYSLAEDLVPDSVFRVQVIPLEEGDPDSYETEYLKGLVISQAPPELEIHTNIRFV